MRCEDGSQLPSRVELSWVEMAFSCDSDETSWESKGVIDENNHTGASSINLHHPSHPLLFDRTTHSDQSLHWVSSPPWIFRFSWIPFIWIDTGRMLRLSRSVLHRNVGCLASKASGTQSTLKSVGTHLPSCVHIHRSWLSPRCFSNTIQSVGAVVSVVSDHSSEADIEEPDPSRQDAFHAHDPMSIDVPLQGLSTNETMTLPFTSEELDALVKDLSAFQQAIAKAKPAVTNETVTSIPISPTPPQSSNNDTTSSPPIPLGSKHFTPPPERPFLASWSVKEVCSWYLQVEDQLNLPELATAEMSFVGLLQKHSIDGSRLLAFTSDPALIPLIPPQLLSKILYLRGLDTYSHMFQPIPGSDDHTRSSDPNMRHLQDILHSTVKIYCTSTSPDFARPWSQKDQDDSTSSGFVISGRRILGNAHGATSATNIRVRKHGDATKYKATVSVISHESDLVLLEVESEKFWKDLQPLQFGHVPRLQDTVIVVGYPTGGDSICVTKGVVSRILVSNYSHSDESLLTVQIGPN